MPRDANHDVQAMSYPNALLASDLDGTLIPSEGGPEHLDAVRRFSEEVEGRSDLCLAYVTGRRRDLAETGIRRIGLPEPDFLVCDVGTSVFARRGGSLELDRTYEARMRSAMGGITAQEVRDTLSTVPGLALQSEEDQSEFKASFEFDGERREVPEAVRARLGDGSLSVVVSFDPYTGSGLLDVLPGGVAKDTAIGHLHDVLDLDPERLCYAGDSGNDVAAMLAGYRIIVVGNAPADLRARLATEAEARGILDRLYFAEAPYAAGVIEGCRHWGLFREGRARRSGSGGGRPHA